MSQRTTLLYEIVYNDLKEKIMSGTLMPNSRIPTQVQLAKQYSVSEMTTKLALQKLVEEGLVSRFRKRGTFVAGPYLNQSELSSNRPNNNALTAIKTIYLTYWSLDTRLFSHPFFQRLMEGIKEVCSLHQIQFRIWDAGPLYELPEEEGSAFIVLSNEIELEALEKWKAEERRMVTVHISFPHLKIPYIIADNYTGGYLATQHLLALHHRRIGILLTGDDTKRLNQEFTFLLEGYKLAFSSYRQDIQPQYIYIASNNEELEEMGYEGCHALMRLPEPPTAIFATSDYKAIGAIRALRELGLRVPENVSVIGYNNLPIADLTTPSLSTVDQHADRIGKRATQILLFEWKNVLQKEMIKDEIPPTLIARESTGPLQEAPSAAQPSQ